MKTTIVYANKYIIRNTSKFKDELLFTQDVKKFKNKNIALIYYFLKKGNKKWTKYMN